MGRTAAGRRVRRRGICRDLRGGGFEPIAQGDVLRLGRIGLERGLGGEAGVLTGNGGGVELGALLIVDLVKLRDDGQVCGFRVGGGGGKRDEGGRSG